MCEMEFLICLVDMKRMMPTSISDMVTIMKITFEADRMILIRVLMSNPIYKDEIPKISKGRFHAWIIECEL